MAFRSWVVGSVALPLALLVTGCHGAVHRLPEIAASDIEAARLDLQADNPGMASRRLTPRQARQKLRRAFDRVHEAGVSVCHEIGLASCDWRFVPVADRLPNAAAGSEGEIFLTHGLAERADSEEEICLVIAHEMAHLAANHPATGERFERLGWEIGWKVGHALDAFSGFGGGRGGRFTRLGVVYGRWIGSLLWVRQREREADTIAVLIAHRAGLDLDRARGYGLKLAHLFGHRESGVFDTHPLGAERLAVVDAAIATVRATDGRLPPRAAPTPRVAWPPRLPEFAVEPPPTTP